MAAAYKRNKICPSYVAVGPHLSSFFVKEQKQKPLPQERGSLG
jgi:hypothetical protein